MYCYYSLLYQLCSLYFSFLCTELCCLIFSRSCFTWIGRYKASLCTSYLESFHQYLHTTFSQMGINISYIIPSKWILQQSHFSEVHSESVWVWRIHLICNSIFLLNKFRGCTIVTRWALHFMLPYFSKGLHPELHD